MLRRTCLFTLAYLGLSLAVPAQAAEPKTKDSDTDRITVGPSDWPWWRGPTRDGVAAANQTPPLTWSESDNVVWKTPVPGRGHGSPTVVGNQVFLATAERNPDVQSVLCYDRAIGKNLWQTPVHRGGFVTKGNDKSTLASSTAACDGQRIFINFLNAGAIYTTALSRAGEILWQKKVADYTVHQGFASSPAVWGALVLVSADSNGGAGKRAALERATGNQVWHQRRPKAHNYASPIILTAAGREQLVMTGCDLVCGSDPSNGEKLWEVSGSTTECVTSTVTDGQRVFTSGGYPKSHVAAVRADGSGKVDWQNNTRIYVPSLLVSHGHLYGVLDAGFAMCWQSDTGKEIWKHRLGGTFSSSPVMVGEHILVTSETGRTVVFKATPKAFELIAENRLGDEVYATPAVCGDRIYMRVATGQNRQRQEMLYCIGNGK